jgi:uncharacterized protein (TIGR03000 family)
LAGHESTATGETRQFTTTELPAGAEWKNYTIRAELDLDGQNVSKEQTISLRAGETREVTFDFNTDDAGKVADLSNR